jgi:hypothetical protein
MCTGVVSTVTSAGLGEYEIAVCYNGDKQQLVVAEYEGHRLYCVELQNGTNIENHLAVASRLRLTVCWMGMLCGVQVM